MTKADYRQLSKALGEPRKSLKRLGFFRKNKLEDQITRITISEFLTLNKAEKFRQEVIAAGQSDAFVTGEKDGTRYLIGELFTLRFFQN